MVNFRVQPKPRFDRLFHTVLIDDGKHAGHGCINKGYLGIRLGAKSGGSP